MGSQSFCLILILFFVPSSVLSESTFIASSFNLRHSVWRKGLPSQLVWFRNYPMKLHVLICLGQNVAPFPSCIRAFGSPVLLNFSGCGCPSRYLGEFAAASVPRFEQEHQLPACLFCIAWRCWKKWCFTLSQYGQLRPVIGQLQHPLRCLSMVLFAVGQLESLQNLGFLNRLNGLIRIEIWMRFTLILGLFTIAAFLIRHATVDWSDSDGILWWCC